MGQHLQSVQMVSHSLSFDKMDATDLHLKYRPEVPLQQRHLQLRHSLVQIEQTRRAPRYALLARIKQDPLPFTRIFKQI